MCGRDDLRPLLMSVGLVVIVIVVILLFVILLDGVGLGILSFPQNARGIFAQIICSSCQEEAIVGRIGCGLAVTLEALPSYRPDYVKPKSTNRDSTNGGVVCCSCYIPESRRFAERYARADTH